MFRGTLIMITPPFDFPSSTFEYDPRKVSDLALIRIIFETIALSVRDMIRAISAAGILSETSCFNCRSSLPVHRLTFGFISYPSP